MTIIQRIWCAVFDRAICLFGLHGEKLVRFTKDDDGNVVSVWRCRHCGDEWRTVRPPVG